MLIGGKVLPQNGEKRESKKTKNGNLVQEKQKTVHETLKIVILVPEKWKKVDSKPKIENLVQEKQKTVNETQN